MCKLFLQLETLSGKLPSTVLLIILRTLLLTSYSSTITQFWQMLTTQSIRLITWPWTYRKPNWIRLTSHIITWAIQSNLPNGFRMNKWKSALYALKNLESSGGSITVAVVDYLYAVTVPLIRTMWWGIWTRGWGYAKYAYSKNTKGRKK